MARLDELEHQILSEMCKVYSQKAIDHAMNPRNVGRIKDADGYGKVTGSCGDTMEIFITFNMKKVVDAKFWTNGCGSSIACGSVTTELIRGKSISEALGIDSDFILNALDGLPESDAHCAKLTSKTLSKAIKSYLSFTQSKIK